MTNGDLGANEWLVDEMFEAYQKDPNSVDPAWIEYFRKNNMVSGNVSAPTAQAASAPVGNALPTAPNGGVPPTPKAAAPKPVTPVAPAPVAPVATPAAPVAPAPVAPAQAVQPAVQPVLNNRNKPEPTPADPQVKPAPVVAAPSSARVEPLRGVAGRVVQSMEASLSVPTATSVRAVPAKLLIDNRIVINNHLKRTRGGKVSGHHVVLFKVFNPSWIN